MARSRWAKHPRPGQLHSPEADAAYRATRQFTGAAGAVEFLFAGGNLVGHVTHPGPAPAVLVSYPTFLRRGEVNRRPNVVMRHRPNAHATISENSSRHIASSCDATRSLITTSAPALRSATAQRVALSRKNGSSVPATR